MCQRAPGPSKAAIAAWSSKKLSVKRSTTRFALSSLPIGKVARWVRGVTVESNVIPASRLRGIFALLEQSVEKRCQLVLSLAAFTEKGGEFDFLSVAAVTGPAHIATRAFVLDEQFVSVRVEHQAPPVLVDAFAALV